jgi:hypothetical protein
MIDDFPTNPYAPPEAPLERDPYATEDLRPVPFEDLEAEPGFWRRVGGMFRLLFSDPYGLVARVPVTEGFGPPLKFMLLLSLPVTALMAAMGLFMGVIGGFTAAQDKHGPPAIFFAGMGLFYTVMMPISAVAGFYMGGAVNHALLWLWGGHRNGRGFHQTLRLHGYYLAFFFLFYLVPLANILVVLGGPAFLGLAMARLHRTDRWRAIVAAYTPLLLCCLCYAGFIAFALAAPALSRR